MIHPVHVLSLKQHGASGKPKSTLYRSACALGLVMILLWPSAFAQGPLSDWKNVQNLAPDSSLRVKTKAGKKYHGDLVDVTADALVLYSSERSFPGRIKRRRTLRRVDIQEVRALAPTASVMVGGSLGAGIGAGLGAIANSTAKDKSEGSLIIVPLALIGSAIGMGIGLHNPIVKGRMIYRVP